MIRRLLPLAAILLGSCRLFGAGADLKELTGQIPLDYPIAEQIPAVEVNWLIIAADDAMATGLPILAERFYRQVWQSEEVDGALRRIAGLRLVTTLIAQRDFAGAADILAAIENDGSPERTLREALLAYQRGDDAELQRILSTLEGAEFDALDLPWYQVLLGLQAQMGGKIEAAEEYFDKAAQLAPGMSADRGFEMIIARGRILAGKVNTDLANELQQRVERYRGQRAGFPFVRQYAVVLDRLGRKAEALAVLREQLGYVTGDEHGERDRLWFLVGLIAGEQSPEGQTALREVIESGSDRDTQRIALQLLARGTRLTDRTDSFLEFLQGLDARSEAEDGLLDEVLLLKAQILLGTGRFQEAGEAAERLLAEFPGSSLRGAALRVLAYIALSQDPPRYRTAADYLARLRSETPPGRQRALLGVMVGDCYFLNADYVNAAGVYSSVLEEDFGEIDPGPVFQQLVLAEIRAGRLDQARAHLDFATEQPEIDLASRWRAEWNFIMELDGIGQHAEAFRRIDQLLKGSGGLAVPTELRLRLMWLEAFLSLKVGQAERTPELSDAILDLINDAPPGTLEDPQRVQIGGHTLLLKGRALLDVAGKDEEGLAVLSSLREMYPGSDSAIRSYLVEARYLLAATRTVDALQRFRELADQYPESPYAPVALYEAMVTIERRGDTDSYQQAGEILRQFIRNYPDHELAFYAQLVQADLHRRLGEFGAAQKVYENLLNLHPDHPDRVRAEIARADCLLAQASKDSIWLDDAAASLERLFDLPNLSPDLRVEAGNKWALALAQQGNRERAQEIYWLVISRFLSDHAMGSSLGETGRYWMARSILELARLFEEERRFQDARQVYELIVLYRLPGVAVARSKLARE